MPDDQTRWEPDRGVADPAWPQPSIAVAMRRGALGTCPACGRSRLFTGWLTVETICPACHAPLGRVRADDAPPYFVILITGHVVVGLILATQKASSVSLWMQAAIFLPLTVVMAVGLLRPVKGAAVGLMLRLQMFYPDDDHA